MGKQNWFYAAKCTFMFATLMLLLAGEACLAYDTDVSNLPAAVQPNELKDIGITSQIGSRLNLDLEFTDESGRKVQLREFFKNDQPVLLSPVYFSCPSLCNLHLNNITDMMRELEWTLGKDFRYLAISFDPQEKSDLAAAKREAYLKSYGREAAHNGWHFLTGDAQAIKTLMQNLGFKYKWSPQANEWAHVSSVVVLTPDGEISQYLQGMQTDSKNLKFALLEASKGKLGTIIENIIMFCFRYDPHKSRYTIYAFNVMRAGAGLAVLILGLMLLPFWIRQRRIDKGINKGVSK